MLQLADIVQAQMRLQPYLQPTLLEHAPDLGPACYLKLENTNKTHSFKIRGALNAVLALEPSDRDRGIIAASSGNHAQGVAYAAKLTAAPAAILMPQHTPLKKINGVRRYGADAVLYGDDYDAAEAEALRRANDNGWTYISPYNDRHVMAGAGTIGLEVLAQFPSVERVLVCVSGGGLISGVATALKHLRPQLEVIGVCAQSAPAMYNAFYTAELPENPDTLAEALSGDIERGSATMPITKQLVDRILLVSEAQIAAAMRWLIQTQGWLVEGGGAVCVAALLAGIVPLDERPTVAIVSGGNLDLTTLQKVIQADEQYDNPSDPIG